jgi:hypothetical protein
MAALTPVLCARSGGGDIAAGLTSAGAGGDTLPSGYQNFLRVKNGNAAACTVTVTPAASGGPLGTTVAPFALSPVVGATTGDRIYGPFPQNPFGDSNGNVNVSYSVTATVTVECLQMSTS